MLGNLACPNQLVDSTKDDYDYSRYRKYVLHSLRKIKFLDSYEISKSEKEIILKESQFYDVIIYLEFFKWKFQKVKIFNSENPALMGLIPRANQNLGAI